LKTWKRDLLGRTIVVEHGKVAKQANGSVFVRMEDTAVIAAATMSSRRTEGIDFVPLTVEFQERFYAAGKIPGGFVKREGRPSESAILSARTIDRPIRPLFPKNMRNEIQLIVTVVSADPENPPDLAGVLAASLALNLSDIPFNGIVAAVRVGLIDGEIVILPTEAQLKRSLLDIVVAGTEDAITMVEGEAKEVEESQMVEALLKAHEAIKEVVEFEKEILSDVSVEKVELQQDEPPAELLSHFEKLVDVETLDSCLFTQGKKSRQRAVGEYFSELVEKLKEEFDVELVEENMSHISEAYEQMLKQRMRESIVKKGIRLDGRKPHEIRPITCEIGFLPRVHGSSLFTRGETQSLGIVTLGAPMDEQVVDSLLEEGSKRFMLHYNFPPFSTGEVKAIRGPSRREIGHGHLAERALSFVLPDEDTFPYTIRVVSEILESNGSSSMATVCSGSLALMDAGVPIQQHVAGVAMGLIFEEDNQVVLTDILGAEDHWGDMDFKVAGTKNGITAFQMDCKVSGVSKELLEKALEEARIARLKILEKLYETISSPRPFVSKYAPVIKVTHIDPSKVAEVIGPGGRVIKGIIKDYDVQVSVDDQTGRVSVIGENEKQVNEALRFVSGITQEVKIGEAYEGKVTRVEPFGIFVEILPGKIGLLHHSKLSKNVRDVNIGESFQVRVTNIDNIGRIQLEQVGYKPKPSPKNSKRDHYRRPRKEK